LTNGSHYVGVAGPQVIGDIMTASTSLGTWASSATYSNQKALYNSEVGTWLGIRWVETNFIPRFARLGDDTAAVTSTNAFGTNTPVVTAVNGGGSLTSATTYYFKVTRKDLTRGFEEDISLAHTMASTATGDNESFTFNFSSLTAGYVYNLYFDKTQLGGASAADANLGLVSANIAVGTTITVTAVATGVSPPTGTAATITVHPVFIHGAESCKWVSLQNLETYVTPDAATHDNPLKLRRKVGYKFMAKAMIADQTRMLRVEVASTY
jgi:hypothetical protein